jgi:hypothetical protein
MNTFERGLNPKEAMNIGCNWRLKILQMGYGSNKYEKFTIYHLFKNNEIFMVGCTKKRWNHILVKNYKSFLKHYNVNLMNVKIEYI